MFLGQVYNPIADFSAKFSQLTQREDWPTLGVEWGKRITPIQEAMKQKYGTGWTSSEFYVEYCKQGIVLANEFLARPIVVAIPTPVVAIPLGWVALRPYFESKGLNVVWVGDGTIKVIIGAPPQGGAPPLIDVTRARIGSDKYKIIKGISYASPDYLVSVYNSLVAEHNIKIGAVIPVPTPTPILPAIPTPAPIVTPTPTPAAAIQVAAAIADMIVPPVQTVSTTSAPISEAQVAVVPTIAATKAYTLPAEINWTTIGIIAAIGAGLFFMSKRKT